MSAYLVDTHLIDYVLTFARSQRASVYVPSLHRRVNVDLQPCPSLDARCNADWIGGVLLAENIRSLVSRYGASAAQDDAGGCDPWAYRFREHVAANAHGGKVAVQALKALACFDYQACESDDYDRTDAAHIVRDMRAEAIRALPGYEFASWGAPEHPARQASGAPGGPVSLCAIMAGRA